jgi:hypothetical protein
MVKAEKKPVKKAPKKAAKQKPANDAGESDGMSLLLGNNMPPNRDVMYHYQTILGLMEKVSAAQSKVSDAKKKAKEAGVDVGALMDTKKMMGLDPLDLAAKLKQQAMLLTELGSPIQFQLFEPKYGSLEEQAGLEGWQDGINARNMNIARWAEGAPGHIEYTRRWNDAQAENASKIGKTGDK